MGWLSQIGGILGQYAAGNEPPPRQVEQHFDQAAQHAPPEAMAQAVTAAFRSDKTPAFGEILSNLFANSNGDQKAGILNSILNQVTTGPLGQTLGQGGSGLWSILANGPHRVTPEEASNVSPEEVKNLAQHAEQREPSIVDQAGQFYAQHPQLVKTLGTAALTAVLAHIASKQQR